MVANDSNNTNEFSFLVTLATISFYEHFEKHFVSSLVNVSLINERTMYIYSVPGVESFFSFIRIHSPVSQTSRFETSFERFSHILSAFHRSFILNRSLSISRQIARAYFLVFLGRSELRNSTGDVARHFLLSAKTGRGPSG